MLPDNISDISYGKLVNLAKHAYSVVGFLTHAVSILRQKTTECHVKKYCVAYLDSIGSFAYTRQVLLDLEHR